MKLHAHIYYEQDQLDQAESLRALILEQFPHGQVGRFHRQPIGPHLKAMFQVKLDQAHLDQMLALIQPVTLGQSILIHPEIEDQILAHTTAARWIGPILPLNIASLTR